MRWPGYPDIDLSEKQFDLNMYLYNIQCTYTLYNNIQYVVYIHIYKMIYNTVRLYDIQHYNIMYTYTYNITYMRTQPPHCMVYSYIFMFFLKKHTHIYIYIINHYVTIYNIIDTYTCCLSSSSKPGSNRWESCSAATGPMTVLPPRWPAPWEPGNSRDFGGILFDFTTT